MSFDVGDTIGVYVPDKISGAYRVYSWALSDGPNGPGDLRMTLELNSVWIDYVIRLRRALENEMQGVRVTPGSNANLAAGGDRQISVSGSITSRLFVGRQEGPHVGLWRRATQDDKYILYFQAVDTSNRPYISIGSRDYETNTKWLTIGYTDKKHIRLAVPSNASGDPEEPTDIELVGFSTGGDVATDTIWDAKGDLAVGTGANTAARLAVGTNGYVLTADSTQATGVRWAVAATSGPGELLLDDDSAFLYDDAGDILYEA